MAGALKWDADSASSVVSDLNSANSEVSGKSVGAPSGCGWSKSAATPVVSELQSTLSDLQRTLPELSKNLSSTDASIRQTDKDSASSTPKSS
ncbi:hypothetical protein BKH31_12380 [Actinomyces oris]|mgnify:FL=1|uniref:Uncharacterized protein n=1 Tax=Actinomyces oris TaxID=544580 RepID=A0A1Q8V5V7_9ACTO|nr:hypothetical protein [Actinomyces oris]OLO43443.1 hypothetical protein BKH31_12380 [Actinomyces oris]